MNLTGIGIFAYLLPSAALTSTYTTYPSPNVNIRFVCVSQFPAVNHPQSLERRYLGILNSVLLDLMKVRQIDVISIKYLLICGFFYVYM